MLRCVAVALCSVLLSSSAFAQVFYAPVQYQHALGYGDAKYYYGGSNPLVRRFATMHVGYGTTLHNFDGGNTFDQPSPMFYRSEVYTDFIPFQNAANFGYTPADARNEAYANAPRYFRKADLLAGAVRQPDGSLVVPADAGGVNAPAPMYSASTMRSAGAGKGQIIIIPKSMLDRPVKDFDKKPAKVAAAE
jgi:hypothetical protein